MALYPVTQSNNQGEDSCIAPNGFEQQNDNYCHEIGSPVLEVFTPETLEMIEAELQNESVLPRFPQRLLPFSAYLSSTTSWLRWKARRQGVCPNALTFMIEPQTLAKKRLQELIILQAQAESSAQSCVALRSRYISESEEWAYLETFLRYLANGKLSSSTSSIVRLLANQDLNRSPEDICVPLPITTLEFCLLLKRYGGGVRQQ